MAGPRPVVERERDDASARGTVVDERGAVGDAADKLWRMKRRKLGLDREENRAAERIGRRGSAGGGFQGAEDLPAQRRAVANPDVCGQERGGQVLVAGARDCRVDVVAGPGTVAQHVQVLESCLPARPGGSTHSMPTIVARLTRSITRHSARLSRSSAAGENGCPRSTRQTRLRPSWISDARSTDRGACACRDAAAGATSSATTRRLDQAEAPNTRVRTPRQHTPSVRSWVTSCPLIRRRPIGRRRY